MSDAPKMSDEDLLNDLADCYDGGDIRPVVDELARRLKIMRELCEADDAHDKGAPAHKYAPLLMRLEAAREAYRQMEAERERP